MKVKHKLERLGVRPRRERGQNFLLDTFFLDRIVEFADLCGSDRVVEIGPGLGALTERLVSYGSLALVEIEPKFSQQLQQRFSAVKVVTADVRAVDFSQFGRELVVFGNIPYVFSTDIIFHLLAQRKAIKRVVLLLQREFAKRLASPPGSREYGSISVAVQLYAKVMLGACVGGDAFHPPTRVESQIIRLDFVEPKDEPGDAIWFERVVRAAFHQRRKKLSNTLKSLGQINELQIRSALQAAGINGDRRAETLSVGEFVCLARSLKTSSVSV